MLDINISLNLNGRKFEYILKSAAGMIALHGRSGSGKSTFVEMLSGLRKPANGYIRVAGETLFDASLNIDLPPERRRIGYVFQDGLLFPHLNVASNLRYGEKRTPKELRKVDFDTVVDLLGLREVLKRPVRNLSGGERQRVAIGRAILTSPRLLAMDEPLANLDAARRADILPFIEALHHELEIPIVYVSHNLDEIVRLTDDIAIIEDGRVKAVGAVEDILSRLDLRPLTGRYEAGSALACVIGAHDDADGLSQLDFDGGTLWVARIDRPVGTKLRVRVRARDVSLALSRPTNVSLLNIVEGTVREIAEGEGPQMDVLLNVGASTLWTRITRRSARELDIRHGKTVFAMIKTVAIDRRSLHLTPATDS